MTMLSRPSYAAILANGASAYDAKIPTNGPSAYESVPKIIEQIPSADDVSSDHERLLNRLKLYELVEHKIMGDGNCQFRSLSDQIYGTSDYHDVVREEIVHQLKSQPESYANFIPMAYGDYLKKMSRNGEWGDNVTLQAAADCYGVKIFVVTSYKDICYIEILPKFEKSDKTILLSFGLKCTTTRFILTKMARRARNRGECEMGMSSLMTPSPSPSTPPTSSQADTEKPVSSPSPLPAHHTSRPSPPRRPLAF